MHPNCIIIHYHELALKGRNRPRFVAQLSSNLRQATKGHGVDRIRSLPGRLVIDLLPSADAARVCHHVADVFGVANYSDGCSVNRSLESLKSTAISMMESRPFESFRIDTRRGDKRYPLTSMQVNEELGRDVQSRRAARVDLSSPQWTLYVEILDREAIVYEEKQPGLGGLPVGVSGRAVVLLSGGIDSPVAAYRMMQRGCRVIFVHFHSHPFLSKASMEKAEELAQHLARHQGTAKLYLIPFGELQRQVVVNTPAPLRVVLYRRLMMRIGAELAQRERAGTLVTGESLGQVASQTLENLQVIEEAARCLVLRPLIGMNKQEIIDQAKRIGTFETSIIPDQDCCQLFVPKHPATKSTIDGVTRAEMNLDIGAMVKAAITHATIQVVRPLP